MVRGTWQEGENIKITTITNTNWTLFERFLEQCHSSSMSSSKRFSSWGVLSGSAFGCSLDYYYFSSVFSLIGELVSAGSAFCRSGKSGSKIDSPFSMKSLLPSELMYSTMSSSISPIKAIANLSSLSLINDYIFSNRLLASSPDGKLVVGDICSWELYKFSLFFSAKCIRARWRYCFSLILSYLSLRMLHICAAFLTMSSSNYLSGFCGWLSVPAMSSNTSKYSWKRSMKTDTALRMMKSTITSVLNILRPRLLLSR